MPVVLSVTASSMVVVDASVVVAALLSPGAARSQLGSPHLQAPHLIDAEVVHALRRTVRAGVLPADGGTAALAVFGQLGLTRHASVPLLARTWELRDNVSAYDAMYVALAEALDCPLVTVDARLAQAPGIRCPVTVLPG